MGALSGSRTQDRTLLAICSEATSCSAGRTGSQASVYLLWSRSKKRQNLMPKREPTRCVHCGQPMAQETRDHVFPKSWYPETTPGEVQRWTAPSCGTCNNKLGGMEKEVFNRLALCVDPRKTEVAGLSAKAMRSLGIGAEDLSPEEAEHRRAQKLKIVGATRPYKAGTETLPGLGPHPGFPEDQLLQIDIPADQLREVAKKMVRGCEFVLANRIIEKPYDVGIYFVHEHNVPDILVRAFEGPSANTTHLGPGFSVTRAAAHDEPDAVMYKIIVWGTLVIYAAILPESDLGDARIT
jgi:hypothetical protein